MTTSNKKIAVSAFALLMALSQSGFGSVQVSDLKRLELVTHDAYSDNFLSVDPSQVDQAVNYYGYYGRQTVGFVESLQLIGANTAAFNRLFKGAPAIDHFYTTSGSDFNAALSYGYSNEGYEGLLRMTPATATMPLYRLSYFWSSTGAVMHWYGTDSAARVNMINQGWYDEGSEGYVWPNPQVNVPLVYPAQVSVHWNSTAGRIIVQTPGTSDPQNE